MTHQSEAQLEENLIKQLQRLGFEKVKIEDEKQLAENLKRQLEKFNGTSFSDSEFAKILNHLNKGDIFQKGKTLRDRFVLVRDDGKEVWIRKTSMIYVNGFLAIPKNLFNA